MRTLAAFLFALLIGTRAFAADLAISLHTPAGQPVSDAVVTVYPASGTPGGPIRFDWPYRMAQKNIQFSPFVLVVPVGATVAFPNLDPVRHHVYSFSPAHPFELKLYGRDETRTVKFDKTGVIALGCNIHDDMTAFIRVVDTPFAIKSTARGEAVIRDIPPGPATLTVWHPFVKARGGEEARQVTIPASGPLSLSIALDLRAAPLRRGGY
jgi:hypothetical protein